MKNNLKILLSILLGVIVSYLFLLVLVYFESASKNSNINSLEDAVWYAVITLTTVGYGDYYPVTLFGRLWSLIVVVGSLGVLSVILGKITIKITTYMENKKNGHFGTKFKNHFVIIGWDSFSKQVAMQIVKSGHKIAIITDQLNDVELIRDSFSKEEAFVLFSDYDNYESFNKVNIDDCSRIFVNFNNDSKSLIHIINLNKQYKDLKYVVILNSQDLKETFKSVGVSYIVSKNEIASKLVASYIFEPDAAYLTEDLMESSVTEDDCDLLQYIVTEENPYLNKEYIDVFFDLKKEHNSILMAISKAKLGYKLLKNPSQKCIIEKGDYLVVMSDGVAKKGIEKLFKTSDGRFD